MNYLSLIIVGLQLAGLMISTAFSINPLWAQESGAVTITGARIAGDGTRTRFVIDISQEVEYQIFLLPSPYRLVIELPLTRFALPRRDTNTGRGLISEWHYGRSGPSQSRIILKSEVPITVDRSFILPELVDQPARLVVDIMITTAENFHSNLTIRSDQRKGTSRGDRFVQNPLSETQEAASLATNSDAITTNKKRPLIILDPGHGGKDPGAIGLHGTQEKIVTFDFSQHLRRRLESNGQYDVLMTREADKAVSLSERIRIAQKMHADLFISIHADSALTGKKAARGASVYTLSAHASDRVAAALAQRENQADLLAGLDIAEDQEVLSDILVDLTRRETKNLSNLFAAILVDEIGQITQTIGNPHRYAGFRVLKAPDIPSVLLELGYLSNSEDEALLISGEWQSKIAQSVHKAINLYFDQSDRVRPDLQDAQDAQDAQDDAQQDAKHDGQ